MIIQTKKHQLSREKYLRTTAIHTLKTQWYIPLFISCFAAGIYYYWKLKLSTTLLLAGGAYLIYVSMIWLAFYAASQMEQAQLLFERFSYHISPQKIILQINAKQGFPIAWSSIQSVKKDKEGYYLFISKAQFIFLPYRIFEGSHQLNCLEILLKRKGLLS